MKRALLCLGVFFAVHTLALLMLPVASEARAGTLDVSSDGSDGEFHPPASVEIDLGLAETASWNTPGNDGRGVYDPNEWAVVFKYTSVTIESGVTVTFRNHPSRAPVIWLVQGNVVINGHVSLDGQDADNLGPAEPGPGGFRGGLNYVDSILIEGCGFGPGGGVTGGAWGPGSYGTQGGSASSGPTYGNIQILPLIGGSGGKGRYTIGYSSGGAGGGAILIAAGDTVTIDGIISAQGGDAKAQGSNTGSGGSGGAIRLVADLVEGDGDLLARGGQIEEIGKNGGDGRIRIETNQPVRLTKDTIPQYTYSPPGNPPLIWPPDSTPTIRVTEVRYSDGTSFVVPDDPRAGFGWPGHDVSIDTSNPVTLKIEATKVPTNWVVTTRVVPLRGLDQKIPATFVSGNDEASVWSAQFTPTRGFSAIQVRASRN